MKILVTGAYGFLGKYILANFKTDKNQIDTIGRTKNNTFINDIVATIPELKEHYDLVIHAAGKAHSVPKNQEESNVFFNVNYNGTVNLLSALKKKPKAFVFISTVSVYGLDDGLEIKETHPLNAHEPYGKSKVIAEQEILKWGKENNVVITILRLPLLVGFNAPGNLKSMINGIKKGYYFNIGKADARKSMVFAEDVVKFIPQIQNKGGIYNLTDGSHPSFKELSIMIAMFFNKKKPLGLNYNLVLFMANTASLLQNILSIKLPLNKRQFYKITKTLTFNDDKAIERGWKPNKILLNKDKWLE